MHNSAVSAAAASNFSAVSAGNDLRSPAELSIHRTSARALPRPRESRRRRSRRRPLDRCPRPRPRARARPPSTATFRRVAASSRAPPVETPSPPATAADASAGVAIVALVATAAAKSGGLIVRDVNYTPVGAGVTVLERVNLELPPTGLNLIVGRSGFGKSTLLSLVSGLAEPTAWASSHSATFPAANISPAPTAWTASGSCSSSPSVTSWARRSSRSSPSRGRSPPESFPKRRELALRLQDALASVGMSNVALDTPVRALSGGYKRRLALCDPARARPARALPRRAPGGDWTGRLGARWCTSSPSCDAIAPSWWCRTTWRRSRP